MPHRGLVNDEEDEILNSELLASNPEAVPPGVRSPAAAAAPPDVLRDYLLGRQAIDEERLARAEEQASSNRLIANLGEAAAKIGGSIAGAPQDTSGFRGLSESADLPLKRHQRQQAQEAKRDQLLASYLLKREATQEKAQAGKETSEYRGKVLEAVAGKQKTKIESDLRGEYLANPNTKQFQDISAAYNRLTEVSKAPSAAGDISMIFSYMKMLDPQSTVREGEFATAQNSGGVPARISNTYNRLMKGERLTEGQRNDFVKQAKNLYGGQYRQQETLMNTYKNLAKESGVSEKKVVIPLSNLSPQQATSAVINERDKQAIKWARENSSDPRAQKILQMHGVQ